MSEDAVFATANLYNVLEMDITPADVPAFATLHHLRKDDPQFREIYLEYVEDLDAPSVKVSGKLANVNIKNSSDIHIGNTYDFYA